MGVIQSCTAQVPKCLICKSPSVDSCRFVCAVCLKSSLDPATHGPVAVLVGGGSVCPGVPRDFIPGMPKAAVSSVKPARRSSGAVVADANDPFGRVGGAEVVAAARTEDVKEDCLHRFKLAEETGAKDVTVASGRQDMHLMSEKSKSIDLVPEGPKSIDREDEEGADVVADKWYRFQIQKKLTVKIPNFSVEPLMRPDRGQLLAFPSTTIAPAFLPSHDKICLKNTVRPSKFRKWTYRADPTAEAELMMRLLADTAPILKSTAPLVLPPCRIRPAPISPLSPPGDPLWKRRCVPCPKSLRVRVTLSAK